MGAHMRNHRKNQSNPVDDNDSALTVIVVLAALLQIAITLPFLLSRAFSI
jgi:hypothetical protein